MADQHDTHDKGSGFWGCAYTFLALGFATFAGVAGTALILGGMTHKDKNAAAEAAPAQAAPAASAPAPASGPASGTAAAPTAPVASGDVLEVTIKPNAANALTYDTILINAKPGQKVKITYVNLHPISPMPHNLLVCKPGSKERIIAAGDAMMTDLPGWQAKDFIPETPDVLHHTKLIQPGETVVLEFVAGEKADYPYLCTFPGHSRIMQGTLKVE